MIRPSSVPGLQPAPISRDILLGSSAVMEDVREALRRLAPFPWPVRIEGPSGSGKGVAARLLHQLSPWAAGPFVDHPLTAQAPGLELTDLVGHTRGAFTDARDEQPGAFESAHGGTLFLDEVADATRAAQRALLHLLEHRTVCRVGEHRGRRLDVRVVVATNQDLGKAVTRKRFRRDLFHRLGALVVQLPALREHPDDIPELTGAILERKASTVHRTPPALGVRDIERLMVYSWPGNVRELENVLEYVIVYGSLPADIPAAGRRSRLARQLLVRDAIKEHGNKAAAARALGISRPALYRQLQRSEGECNDFDEV